LVNRQVPVASPSRTRLFERRMFSPVGPGRKLNVTDRTCPGNRCEPAFNPYYGVTARIRPDHPDDQMLTLAPGRQL
jgi:hypothetical protein